jgi:hypothetical protein
MKSAYPGKIGGQEGLGSLCITVHHNVIGSHRIGISICINHQYYGLDLGCRDRPALFEACGANGTGVKTFFIASCIGLI